MRLYFMKQKALDTLQKEVPEIYKEYKTEEPWVSRYFDDKGMPLFYFDTGIDVPDYELIIGGPETDSQNARIIYEAYREKLNPIQASDLRLWAYLAHEKHWNYMTKRWKIDVPDEEDEQEQEGKTPKEKTIDRVKSRYFFGDSRGKAFVRQGIARLFWSAHLTYDKNNADPYEYTDFILNNQDVFTSITERSFARNKTIALAVLKELKKHPELSRDDKRAFLANLNQAGAITVFDYLNPKQATELCSNVLEKIKHIAILKDGSMFKLYHNITGKSYGGDFVINKGRAVAFGKPISTKPASLVGKREGSKVTISGQVYTIKEIK